jgi:hypothetical protein
MRGPTPKSVGRLSDNLTDGLNSAKFLCKSARNLIISCKPRISMATQVLCRFCRGQQPLGMSMRIALVPCLIGVFLSIVCRGSGQVPSTISYQGRVQVSGTNFTGNGLLKFALVSHGTNLNRQATATATVNSGFVTSIAVVDGGYGYQTPPAVTITGATGSGESSRRSRSTTLVMVTRRRW